MKQELLEHIVCPRCSGEFELKNKTEKNGEVFEGTLICDRLHRFHVTKGVPRLIVPDSKTIKSQTIRAFSKKWHYFERACSPKRWMKLQYKWYLDRYWGGNESRFKRFLQTRRLILDAGTGIGHSAKWLSANPKAQVFAIDLSEGIDVAYKNYGKTDNIHFMQADLTKLPFKMKFDFILSDQVLMNTANTVNSFRYLTKFLARNGVIGIYVYKKKGPIREFCDDYIRSKVKSMPVKEALKLSRAITLLGRNLAKLNAKITVPEDISVLGIKKGKYDLQRFIYWHVLKCFWSEDPNVDMDTSIAVNFDWYYPEYGHRHEPDEVRSWFAREKLKILRFDVIYSGISVMGKKL